MIINNNIINNRLSWDLDVKIMWAQKKIKEFYYKNNKKVYVSFSGGKDSTVLLHLVRSIFPEVEAVFSDTGLEYPEIKDFVKTKENVTWVRPETIFIDVLKNYGYPVISKNVSRYVRDLQNPTPNNQKTRNLRMGLLPEKSKVGVLSKKWRFLIDAPFKCSEQCCDIMKKKPMKKFQKESGKAAIIGTMIEESQSRKISYMKNGCFNVNKNQLTPISIFTEKDVWEYIKLFDLKYSVIYDMGEKRTGCMFCMFGVQYDSKNDKNGKNRFERLSQTHHTIHKYCMNNLGLKEVLEYINIPTGLEKNIYDFGDSE